MSENYREGIRKWSAMVSIVAPATPINLYLLTAGRTAILRKLHMFNRNAANTIVQVGTGLGGAFAQNMPGWFVSTGQDREVGMDSLEPIVDLEYTATITVQATVVAAAPNDVQVIAEVEEFQGPTG